jgi:hypothetical protein
VHTPLYVAMGTDDWTRILIVDSTPGELAKTLGAVSIDMTRAVHTYFVPPSRVPTRSDVPIGVLSQAAADKTSSRVSKAVSAQAVTNLNAATAWAATNLEKTRRRVRTLRSQVHGARPSTNTAHP